MTKKIYTIDDTSQMDWAEFGKILDALTKKLEDYQKENNIKFDIIAPILRNGGIPAIAIANRLQITRFLPVQVKYTYDKDNPKKTELKQLLSLPEILQETPDNPNILVCEVNTGSGQSANKSIELIKEKYPTSTIYYATVAKTYGGPDNLEHVKEYFWGIQTNEHFKVSEDEAKCLGLRSKITIFPWETAEFELADINAG
ncbi:phosphoribosyltransferase [Candidatus Kuenenbacteria bacterium]|nr:phosphoribosyltransferase [Candidatus Kuenenbacteria bacterium]